MAHPYSSAWGRGGPLDQTPTPGPTPYQDYVDQYQALNDAWYDSWLNPVPPSEIAVPETGPQPLAPAPTPASDPFSMGGGGGGGDAGSGVAGGYGSVPGNPNGMSLGGMFSGPTTELFGDTQYSDIEPGALSMMGLSSGTGIVGTGPYAEVRDVVAFDPASLGAGLIGSALGGPLGGALAGYIGGQLNPHEFGIVDMGLTSAAHPNAIGVMRGNLAEPGLFSSRQLAAAERAFMGAAPTLDLSGGPMSMGGYAPGFGGGSKAAQKGYSGPMTGPNSPAGGGGYGGPGSGGRGGGFAPGFGPGSKAASKRGGRGGGGYGASSSGKGGIGGY